MAKARPPTFAIAQAAALPRPAVIVIGASAGGVETLLPMLARLGPGAPPVVVVLHVRRDRPSLLANIFASACAIPVSEAVDGEPLLPGTIAFAPPDYHLLLDRGPRLRLSLDPPLRFSRPSIDVLFETAADVLGAGVLAIVLSGYNDDGTQGAGTVVRAGGRVLVQDPDTARGTQMPSAALAGVPGASMVTPAVIADLLERFSSMTDHP